MSKAAKDAHGNADNGKTAKRMRMRKRDIVGPLYMCQEVDTFSSTLVATPMLLQSGSIVLLVPLGGTAGADDPSYVYVSSLIPLKEIVRITPQRGKSVTLFFRDRKLSCRTFLTRDTDAISAAIRQMIAATGGVKRGRDDDSNPLTQLLSYLSPEHSEKAKEVSEPYACMYFMAVVVFDFLTSCWLCVGIADVVQVHGQAEQGRELDEPISARRRRRRGRQAA